MGNQFDRLQTPEYLIKSRVQRLETVNTACFKSISGLLKEGIVSLSNICKSLLDAHVDPSTGKCSNYEEIREHIEHSEQCMKKTETMINEKLVYLDESMEQLIREKHNLDQQKNEKSMDMDKSHIEMKSAEDLFQNSKAALVQAEENVKSAKHAVQVIQERKNTGTGLAIAGGILFAIPGLGWILGPILLTAGLVELNQAKDALSAAEKEQHMNDLKVNESIEKMFEYKKKIFCAQSEIEKTNEALKRIERAIKGIQKDLEDTGNIQQKVREAVFLLSVLSGRVVVLEKQSKFVILWEPVVKTMEDVIKAVVNVAENRLLCSDGLSGLINTLRENVGGLRALYNSPSHSEYDSYF
ncbi:unnamed protein product [Leuciscus chuanchicus]